MGQHRIEDVDPAIVRRALATCLPEVEPPIGMRLDRIRTLGRRRQRVWRAVPLAAAVVAAAAVAVPWAINSAGPPQDAGPAASATAAPVPVLPQPDYRMFARHHLDIGAEALTRVTSERLAGKIAFYFGARSEATDHGNRYAYAFSLLWEEDGRYGYLLVLHRTLGLYPATDYGLPAEPCAEPDARLPAYNCTPFRAPRGDSATAFEVTDGYRMRGLVWDKKDPAGGPDIRVTTVFYLPAPGAWTPFPALDTKPRLTDIPLSVDDMARISGMPS